MAKREACLDLIIGDMPDGLPVPNISHPPLSVPYCNTYDDEFAEYIFEFASGSLQDDGAVMFFLPDNPKIRHMVDKDAKLHGFKMQTDWWGVNELRMTSHKDINCMVMIYFELL